MSTKPLQHGKGAVSGWKDSLLKNPIDQVCLAGMVGTLPLVFLQAQFLWERPHFQFFPIAWLAFLFLVYRFGILGTTAIQTRLRAGVFLLIVAFLMLLAAVILLSPWLAQLTLTVVLIGWGLMRLGGNPWHQILAWSTLLFVTLPLPKNLDNKLVQGLQAVSSDSASSLLDLSRVPHFPAGNIIEVGAEKLFVDQACSGIDGLYSLLAMVILISIWQQASFLVSLGSLLSVPLWAWFGNVLRIYTITFVLSRFGVDWTHGWQHTAIGLVLFAFSFFCLTQTIQVLKLLLARTPASSPTASTFKLYNRIVEWPNSKKTNSLKSVDSVPAKQESGYGKLFMLSQLGFFSLGVLSLFPTLGIGPWRDSKLSLPKFSEAQIATTFAKSLLPDVYGGYKVVHFEQTRRERGSVFGEHSVTWTYSNGRSQFTLSLDFPFDGFHSLEDCYVGSGHAVNEISVDPTSEINEVRLTSVDQESVYLGFLEFDISGNTIERTPKRSFFERGILELKQKPVTYQLQLFSDDGESISPEQDLELDRRGILQDALPRLLPGVQELVGQTSS